MTHARDLTIFDEPPLASPRLVLGFSGWMDGGEVSTGAIAFLNDKLNARPFAEIEPEDFYLYAPPDGYEDALALRPTVILDEGLLEDFEEPVARFTHDAKNNLILFSGREPNLQWRRFSDCLFQVVERYGVEQIYFVGSVAGAVPHTRRPRMFGAITDPDLRNQMEQLGLRPSNYEGPASFVSFVMREAALRHVPMLGIVAEIPAYVEGHNARCIETAVRTLSEALDLTVDVSPLSMRADSFEKKLNDMVEQRDDLAAVVRRMEAEYDRVATDDHLDELGEWFRKQGIHRN